MDVVSFTLALRRQYPVLPLIHTVKKPKLVQLTEPAHWLFLEVDETVTPKDLAIYTLIPMHFSQALERSQVAVNDSYSGAPLHMPTLTAAGTNVR